MDAITMLRRDQERIDQVLADLEHTEAGDQSREWIAHRLAAIYALHSAGEAEWVYPLVRERIVGGDLVVDERLAKRKALESNLRVLDVCEPGDPRFDLTLWTVRTQAYRDLYEERRYVLPQLAAVCTRRELAVLAQRIRRARRHAPMRPHPWAPGTPPLNRLTNPALGALDRLQRLLARTSRSLHGSTPSRA